MFFFYSILEFVHTVFAQLTRPSTVVVTVQSAKRANSAVTQLNSAAYRYYQNKTFSFVFMCST